jgi:spore coat protein CotH
VTSALVVSYLGVNVGVLAVAEALTSADVNGYEDVVIRSNNSETSLNEAVSLDLLEEAGLASQQAAATSFSVNGGDPVLRLAIENPDDDAWQEANFESEGALYKAESTGDWSYRGDDPGEYEEVFDQEGGSDVADLTPLIEFLQFVNEADDATFAEELPERLDVGSFARYLAMMDLLGNFDDIDGPGNNAYLWYDVETEQFTVVPWDMNLTLGTGLGGMGGEGGPPEGSQGGPPEGFQPLEGADIPEGLEPPDGFDPGQMEGGGPFGRSNALVERFHANADVELQYQYALNELGGSLYGGDVAERVLDAWVNVLSEQATGLVSEAAIAEEAETIAQQFTTTTE